MSHFSVLVIGSDWQEQLAPFQENNMGDCPAQYLEFDDRTEEVNTRYESTAKGVWTPTGEFLHSFEDKVAQLNLTEAVRDVPYKEIYPDFKKFLSDYYGYGSDVTGIKYGFWENPNAKWDWYIPGGRWDDYFKFKPGVGKNTSVLAKDIDWQAMQAANLSKAIEDWTAFQAWSKEGGSQRHLPYFDFGVKPDSDNPTGFESFETFKQRRVSVAPFAILKNNVWCKRGDMGWWGCVSDSKDAQTWEAQFELVVAALDPLDLITIIDCHI